MKKKIWKSLTALTLLISISAPTVKAEGENFSDTAYWMDFCTTGKAVSPEDKQSCQAFMQYQSQGSASLQQQLADIREQIASIRDNILKYAEKVRNFQIQADALNEQIADLNGQIAVKEKEIETLQAKIDADQAEIDAAEEKLKARMVKQQETMRLNKYLDVIMGAQTFTDLLRIAGGLNVIAEYDEKIMAGLADQIEQMNADKAKIEEDKESLALDRQQVVDKQNTILAYKYAAQQAEEAMKQQQVELEAQGNRIAGNIAEIQKQMQQLASALNQVAPSLGWTYPVPGVSVNQYAGTWHYRNWDGSPGGTHLGADFSGPLGSSVVAVGNGVVLKSTDGCEYGHLGDGCGSGQGGSWGGGNQVYLLTSINGALYAVKYLHLLKGTPIATGTIVTAGQEIAKEGSSGNSTGPHCHIEVFFLGNGSLSSYAQSWNGDLAFGCGWGGAALNRLCENGIGAPCRMKPEMVFGA